jgi:hypothetical protein
VYYDHVGHCSLSEVHLINATFLGGGGLPCGPYVNVQKGPSLFTVAVTNIKIINIFKYNDNKSPEEWSRANSCNVMYISYKSDREL